MNPYLPRLTAILVALALTPAYSEVAAQPYLEFFVTGSSPESGAVSVAEAAQITFEFSEMLDVSHIYASGLPIDILDPVGEIASRIQGYQIQLDGRGITLDLTNPAESDLAIMVTSAKSIGGAYLCAPFALNYSTKTEAGAYSVSGWTYWAVTTKSSSYNCPPSFGPTVVAALFDAAPDPTAVLHYGAVSVDYEYIIENVSPGTYWPYFFFDFDFDGKITPLITPINTATNEVFFYDPDDAYAPVSITVDNLDLTDVSTVLFGPGATENVEVPGPLRLGSVFPTPFSDRLDVHFELDRPSTVELRLIDLTGRTLVYQALGVLPVGMHRAHLSGASLSAGTYFLQLRTPVSRQTKPLIHIAH